MTLLIIIPLLILLASIIYTSLVGIARYKNGASGENNQMAVFKLLIISRVISFIIMLLLQYMLLLSGVVVIPALPIGYLFHYVAIYLIYSQLVDTIFRMLRLWHALSITKKKLRK